MGNLAPFPMLAPDTISMMVTVEASISIVGLTISLMALAYDHVVYVPFLLHIFLCGWIDRG